MAERKAGSLMLMKPQRRHSFYRNIEIARLEQSRASYCYVCFFSASCFQKQCIEACPEG